ncbi:hypothetical protein TBLA_0A07990 [Henningerozyma blattae CBS 6284]|uniref:GPR1/FUN34/YaaH-class plasma membrane protein n=1 Tax=Henningerozyma blattae (strain ATCC 34711 / CBS 6284 / DSM 70876 / NBRC 10599 / NRRL Y-10934 / UCD 77-7) TaxID=1071380 RepID=I2GWT7_HENB6|nr:hypothetical protein TBLA_0A07990 [Tetrapisispora blattae CBS 6284]CCH58589.1 hypothetical protein TBLA_0A07990 [Tetrapisispora blattae CBS 6284]
MPKSVHSTDIEGDDVSTTTANTRDEVEDNQDDTYDTYDEKQGGGNVVVDGEYVSIGPRIYKQDDVVNLFNALQKKEDFNEYKPEVPASSGADIINNFVNPIPLGLSSYSLSFFVLALVSANVRGVTNAKLFVPLYIFLGGVVEMLVGILCFIKGDTYGSVVFFTYGGFWLSWGCINVDQFHSISGYGEKTEMLDNAIGFFMIAWCVFTFFVTLWSLKSAWAVFFLFFFLFLTFLMLGIGAFTADNKVSMAGGYFGILSSCCGWYSLYCIVSNDSNTYIPLRLIMMPANDTTIYEKTGIPRDKYYIV